MKKVKNLAIFSIALLIFGIAGFSPALAVNGFQRHVELDQYATGSAEANGAATDLLGPDGSASGDGIVDFLYSYRDKGVITYSGREYNWHEEIRLTNAYLRVERDTNDAGDTNQYDEIYMEARSGAVAYRLVFDTPIPSSYLQGKDVYFFGKKYTVQSATTDEIKFAYDPGVFVLKTTGAKTMTFKDGTTLTLDGVYSQGTGSIYKAKITVQKGSSIETKFITGGSADTIAGTEVYVKNAVVTTEGTNEGEAQVSAGNSILTIEDGGYVKDADSKTTTWQANIITSGNNIDYIEVADTQDRTTSGISNHVLEGGGFMQTPINGIQIVYKGATAGLSSTAKITATDIDFMPDGSRDLSGDGTADAAVRIKSPSSSAILFTQDGTQKRGGEIWLNSGNDYFYYRDSSNSSYVRVTSPLVSLGTYTATIAWSSAGGGTGTLTITEPSLRIAGSAGTITIEYNGGTGVFADITGDTVYANDGLTSAYIAKTSETRDYYTRYGTYIDSASTSLVSMLMPTQQLYGFYVLNKVSVNENLPVIEKTETGAAAETITNATAEDILGSSANEEWAQNLVDSWKEAQAEQNATQEASKQQAVVENKTPVEETQMPAEPVQPAWKIFLLKIWNFIW